MRLPADSSEVSESFLIETLNGLPSFQADPVQSTTMQSIGVGIGQLSSLILASLTCESGQRREVVVKLHAPIAEMHQIALDYGLYAAEVNFYRDLAPEIPMRLPEIYLAELDEDNGRVFLLMESFSNWRSPDQVVGATKEEVETAVDGLVTLASTYWNQPRLSEISWLNQFNAAAWDQIDSQLPDSVDEALRRLGNLAPASMESSARAIVPHANWFRHTASVGNQVLSHQDYRVENFFYSPEGEFAVIDWQLLKQSNPAFDLAYLLGSNIDTSLRREIEQDLLQRFHGGLVSKGVSDYSFDDLIADYRLSMIGVSFNVIIAGANVDESNERTARLIRAYADRVFDAIEEWDCVSLLP